MPWKLTASTSLSTSAYTIFINGGHLLEPTLIRHNTDARRTRRAGQPVRRNEGVGGASSAPSLDTARGFSQAGWQLLRVIADGLEFERGRDSMRNGELLRAWGDDQWAAWRTAGSCGAA
jgi:hypothetical protein